MTVYVTFSMTLSVLLSIDSHVVPMQLEIFLYTPFPIPFSTDPFWEAPHEGIFKEYTVNGVLRQPLSEVLVGVPSPPLKRIQVLGHDHTVTKSGLMSSSSYPVGRLFLSGLSSCHVGRSKGMRCTEWPHSWLHSTPQWGM